MNVSTGLAALACLIISINTFYLERRLSRLESNTNKLADAILEGAQITGEFREQQLILNRKIIDYIKENSVSLGIRKSE